jgi:hypothetical protein
VVKLGREWLSQRQPVQVKSKGMQHRIPTKFLRVTAGEANKLFAWAEDSPFSDSPNWWVSKNASQIWAELCHLSLRVL